MDMNRMMALAGLEENSLIIEGANKSFWIYSIFSKDGSKIYCSTMDGDRALWSGREVAEQLRIFNANGKPTWFAEQASFPMEEPTQGEDRPGSGYEHRSDDTSERDGPDYDDQFGHPDDR